MSQTELVSYLCSNCCTNATAQIITNTMCRH